jgi:hypothetical protein
VSHFHVRITFVVLMYICNSSALSNNLYILASNSKTTSF